MVGGYATQKLCRRLLVFKLASLKLKQLNLCCTFIIYKSVLLFFLGCRHLRPTGGVEIWLSARLLLNCHRWQPPARQSKTGLRGRNAKAQANDIRYIALYSMRFPKHTHPSTCIWFSYIAYRTHKFNPLHNQSRKLCTQMEWKSVERGGGDRFGSSKLHASCSSHCTQHSY